MITYPWFVWIRSFVPPVRDEESETQRKAHAKRVRETRRSTQGVTLDEIKSAEQLVKKKQQQSNDVVGSTATTTTATTTPSSTQVCHRTYLFDSPPSFAKKISQCVVNENELKWENFWWRLGYAFKINLIIFN